MPCCRMCAIPAPAAPARAARTSPGGQVGDYARHAHGHAYSLVTRMRASSARDASGAVCPGPGLRAPCVRAWREMSGTRTRGSAGRPRPRRVRAFCPAGGACSGLRYSQIRNRRGGGGRWTNERFMAGFAAAGRVDARRQRVPTPQRRALVRRAPPLPVQFQTIIRYRNIQSDSHRIRALDKGDHAKASSSRPP